jgi:hypothetical protein
MLAAAVDAYARGLDFADALHLAHASFCARMLSFDRALVRRAGRLRLTPPCEVPGIAD